MADEQEIKTGDVVTLKSGSRPLTVTGFFKADTANAVAYAEVVWDHNPAGIRHERVAVCALIKA